MTQRKITDQIEDAFLEDCTNSWLDAADRHCIPHHLAEVILLDEILRDFHLADPVALRAYAIATLDALDAKDESSAEHFAACARRKIHGPALVAAMDKLAADTVIEPTIIPGARLQ